MKFISWNVNGLRACVRRVSLIFQQYRCGFLLYSGVKLQVGQIDLDLRAITSTGITLRKRLFRHSHFCQKQGIISVLRHRH